MTLNLPVCLAQLLYRTLPTAVMVAVPVTAAFHPATYPTRPKSIISATLIRRPGRSLAYTETGKVGGDEKVDP